MVLQTLLVLRDQKKDALLVKVSNMYRGAKSCFFGQCKGMMSSLFRCAWSLEVKFKPQGKAVMPCKETIIFIKSFLSGQRYYVKPVSGLL